MLLGLDDWLVLEAVGVAGLLDNGLGLGRVVGHVRLDDWLLLVLGGGRGTERPGGEAAAGALDDRLVLGFAGAVDGAQAVAVGGSGRGRARVPVLLWCFVLKVRGRFRRVAVRSRVVSAHSY